MPYPAGRQGHRAPLNRHGPTGASDNPQDTRSAGCYAHAICPPRPTGSADDDIHGASLGRSGEGIGADPRKMYFQRVAGVLSEEARQEIQHRALGAVMAGIDHRETPFEGMMRLVVFHIAG
jgi:hypothetical protein